MGKQCKSEIKKTKKNNSGGTRRRRMNSFGPKPVQKRKIVSKASKKFNILDTYNSFIYPSTSELIQSLDDNNVIDTTSGIFSLKFLSKLSEREFYIKFKEGINFAKKNFKSDNLKILKEILLLLKDINGLNSTDEFGIEKCKNNNLMKVCKFDLILTLLSDQSKLENLGIKNANDVNEIRTKFEQSLDYVIFESYKDMENAELFNPNSNGQYSYQSFVNILFSPTIISLYKDILYELYYINISKKELIKKVEEFIKNHNIYFVKMPVECFGMLLYDGTIIVNSVYNISTYRNHNAFIIYFTLLHEIMHAISRILRGNDNYLLNTNEFTKNKKIRADESGEYFENKFLIDITKKKTLSVVEADYLVDINNYQFNNIKDFHSSFNEWRDSKKDDIKNSQTFTIAKSGDMTTFSINIGCYCHGDRKKNN